ncbi:MAG: hypothetical protein V1644_02860 [Candidatus Micrarchaeota archaeon]
MAKSVNLNDKQVYEIVASEISNFNKLIKGHEKILRAIGNL